MKKFAFMLGMALVASACSEDTMDNLNRNENDPENVPARLIFTDTETSSAVNLISGDFAFYTAIYMEQQVGIFNQMYNAEMRLSEVYSSSTFDNSWNSTYRNLNALQIIRKRCSAGGEEAGANRLLGMAEILTALNLATLTDLMGDIPWSEALQPGKIYQPKPDKQEAIYQEVFTLLDQAIEHLGMEDSQGVTPVGTQDLIYGSLSADEQARRWQQTAYGLKARYTLRLSLRHPQYAQVIDWVDKSYSQWDEQCAYPYDGSTSINPFYAFYLNRRYFGASESLHRKLAERNDPRERLFFIPYPGQSEIRFAPNGAPEQRQGYYGLSGILSPTRPTLLLSYHELQFIKAEAQIRLGDTQAAQASLRKAVTAAFEQVGLSPEQADAYFTTEVAPRFNANPLNEIILQKYLASYEGEVVESYNDHRRLLAMGDKGVTLDNPLPFPLRLPYGNSDVVNNPNLGHAYGDGSYITTTPVWWAGGTR